MVMSPDYDKLTTTLAENVRRYRLGAELSQKELAEGVGTSYPRISEIENGRGNPTLETLMKIASVLDVSVIVLLSDPGVKRKNKARS
jgi:transcriptional regulator with XRE-family HTH domain